jgi:hypothetical protein
VVVELVLQLSNAIAVAVVGVLVWFYMRGRFEQVDRRFDQMAQRFDRIEQNIATLRADMDRKFELLVTELNAVRSDLTRVALAVGARPEANPA